MPTDVFLQNFTGASATDLTATTPTTGSGAWSLVGSTTGRILLDGNGGCYCPDSSATYVNPTTIPANATVSFSFVVRSDAVGGPGVMLCESSSSESGYNCRIYANGTGDYNCQFFRFDNGSAVQLGSVSNPFPLAVGDLLTFTIPPRDSANTWTVSLSKNGGTPTTLFTATDSTYSGVGPLGWRNAGPNTATAGYHATALRAIIPGASGYTLTGPATGIQGQPATYTVQANGTPSSSLVITPTATIAGTFAPITLTITDSIAHIFTFTPSVTGSGAVATGHTGGGFTGDPIALAYLSTAPPTPVDLAVSRLVSCDFGSAYAGLATVGITLRSPNSDGSTTVATARTTVGVGNLSAGIYLAAIPRSFAGLVVWDTGGSSPVSLVETINAASATGGASDPWATPLPGTYATGTAGAILGQRSGFKLASDGIDAITVETGVNFRQAISPILAASAGVVSGAGTGVVIIKGGNTSTTRIVASTDSNGNRTSVTLSLPG